MPSKTKIYLINQSEYEVTSAEEMNTLSNNVLTKTEQAKYLKVQLKELKSKTAEISAMAELIRQKTTLESQLSKISSAIMIIKQQTSIDPTEIQKEKDRYWLKILYLLILLWESHYATEKRRHAKTKFSLTRKRLFK